MKIEIERLHVKDNPYNKVTEDLPYKKRRIRDRDGNLRFNDNGIFSEKIFGRIGECKCGKTKEAGEWCPSCGCRVIDRKKMPQFYIPCEIPLPFIAADYEVFGKYAGIVEDLMKYKSFLYDGEVIEFNLEEIKCEEFEKDKIKIGFEAVKALNIGATNEWFKENTVTNISIPHPIFRPIIDDKKTKIVYGGPLNEALIDLLRKRNQILSFLKFNKDDKLGVLAMNKMLQEKYEQFLKEVFNIIKVGKKCLLNQEILSQPITGAIRAIITNHFGLDEDIILIGKEFIDILFPHLYKKHKGNYEKINEELKQKDYHVLVNRPPTIGQKSVIFMKPRINMDDDYRFLVSTDPIIYDGLAADTDGDVFLVIGIYTEEANYQASQLVPSKNYINCSDGFIRNKIPEDFMYAYSQLDKCGETYKEIENIRKGRDLEELPRDEYIKIYRLLGKEMWESCNIPTVGDIAEVFEGENEKFNNVTNFFDNKDKVMTYLNKECPKYSQEESSEFIADVISSNTTDISDSGWFYKKLMASCDDVRIISEDCGSKGVKVKVSDIDEGYYNFRIKFSYVEELDKYVVGPYLEFIEEVKELDFINVRTPITCKEAPNRKICKKCSGVIKKNKDESFIPRYFGLFTTLMITEHATQASLDSMNKGKSKNINHALDESPKSKTMDWEEVVTFVNDIVNNIGDIGVQSRFYEVALISRIHKREEEGLFYASSFQHSFHRQEDLLGIFAYSSTWRNFIKMLKKKKFEANSIKSQICFDIYTSQKC